MKKISNAKVKVKKVDKKTKKTTVKVMPLKKKIGEKKIEKTIKKLTNRPKRSSIFVNPINL